MAASVAVVVSWLLPRSSFPEPVKLSVVGLRIAGKRADAERPTVASAPLLMLKVASDRIGAPAVAGLPAKFVVPLLFTVAVDGNVPLTFRVAPAATVTELL